MFLFAYHLSKFRDLRKGDDEFSLGGFGGVVSRSRLSRPKCFPTCWRTGRSRGFMW